MLTTLPSTSVNDNSYDSRLPLLIDDFVKDDLPDDYLATLVHHLVSERCDGSHSDSLREEEIMELMVALDFATKATYDDPGHGTRIKLDN